MNWELPFFFEKETGFFAGFFQIAITEKHLAVLDDSLPLSFQGMMWINFNLTWQLACKKGESGFDGFHQTSINRQNVRGVFTASFNQNAIKHKTASLDSTAEAWRAWEPITKSPKSP